MFITNIDPEDQKEEPKTPLQLPDPGLLNPDIAPLELSVEEKILQEHIDQDSKLRQ